MATILCRACGVRHSTWSRAWLRHRKAHYNLDPRTEARIHALGIYNSEVARGLMHTPDFVALMRDEQKWFDGLPK